MIIGNVYVFGYTCDTVVKILVYLSRNPEEGTLVRFMEVQRNILLVTGVCNLGNILCLIALFRWRKWGVYGWIAMRVISLGSILVSGPTPRAFVFLIIDMLLLYLVLNLGGEKRAWTRLR